MTSERYVVFWDGDNFCKALPKVVYPIIFVSNIFPNSRLIQATRRMPLLILADQSTLSKLGVADYAPHISACPTQRYTYRVLQTIQMKLKLLCVWTEPVVLGSTKSASKFKYEIEIG